jgi:hypothetical protein
MARKPPNSGQWFNEVVRLRMMPQQEQYVELNRRFRKLDEKIKAEEAAVESYALDLLPRRDDTFG